MVSAIPLPSVSVEAADANCRLEVPGLDAIASMLWGSLGQQTQANTGLVVVASTQHKQAMCVCLFLLTQVAPEHAGDGCRAPRPGTSSLQFKPADQHSHVAGGPLPVDLLLGKFLQNVPDQCTRDLLNIDEYHVIIHTAVLFGLLNQSESDVFHGTT